MFYRERKDFYRVYADSKEEAQEKLNKSLDKEMEDDLSEIESIEKPESNEYYDGSEIAIDFTFSHQLDETRNGKYFK